MITKEETIAAIKLTNTKRYSDEEIARMLNVPLGELCRALSD